MKPTLQLKQGTQLSLTPQLQQAIRLLQLNNIELQHEIQQYLESNPLLELAESDYPTDSEEPAPTQEETLETLDLSSDINIHADLDEHDWESNQQNEDNLQTSSPHNNVQNIADQSALGLDLKKELLWQLESLALDDAEKLAAYFIIDSLEDNGFLSQSTKEIFTASNNKAAISFKNFEQLRQRIQLLDPIGCASQSLSEFLLLQLSQTKNDTPYRGDAIYLLKRHEHLLAQRDYELLKKRSRFNEERLTNSLLLIQSLATEPYSHFPESQIEYIIPDLYLTKEQDLWKVQLNPSNHIVLKIDSTYESLAKETQHPSDKQYLQNNLQEARWLISSLQNRDETLLKVASKIIELQQDFIEQGDIALRPLTHAQIADAINMHESTISRACTGKYILTPRGVLELKYFFSNQINTDAGSDCSSTAIRAMIKLLIDNEDSRKPLSDSKITKLLEQQGVQIARRTVAKYREEMTISPSSERKKL